MAETLRAAVTAGGLPVRILGPAPAPVARLQGNYRYHFQLSAADVEPIQSLWKSHAEALKPTGHVELAVDVDPINLR
jgi:primosomal protein N' (replication factor Y)